MQDRHSHAYGFALFATQIFATAALLLGPTLFGTAPARADFTEQATSLVGTGGIPGWYGIQEAVVALSADGNTMAVGGPWHDTVDDGNPYNSVGALWIWTRSNGTWTQQAGPLVPSDYTRTCSNTIEYCYVGFGNAVAISADGNTVAVGAPNDEGGDATTFRFGKGALWVFTRSGGVWTQQGSKLVPSDATGDSGVGVAITLSADGNTMVATAGEGQGTNVGAFYTYTRSGNTWSQLGLKVGPPGDAVGSSNLYFWSPSLSADGNTLAMGASGDSSNIGASWIYRRQGGAWVVDGSKIVPSDYSGAAGAAGVFLSGDGLTLAVGGGGDSGGAGAAWIFVYSGGVWTQQGTKLVPSDLNGAGGAPNFGGVALSYDGNYLAGAAYHDTPLQSTGAVWAFKRSAGTWSQVGTKLVGSTGPSNSEHGAWLAMSADGTTIADGARTGGPNGAQYGAVWVFTQPPTISSVTANSGSLSGGTGVTISGTLFGSTTAVTFGGSAATNVVVVDANTITATTPAHAQGAVDVVVTTEHGSATSVNAYTYTKNNSTTAVNGTPQPSSYGQQVTFTATVTNGATGNVTFKDGLTTLGTTAISGNTAQYQTSTLSVGAHSITATYNGDSSYNSSTSAPFSQTVNKANSSTALGASPNPSSYGQQVTFTATVTPSTATGNVTFKEGATTLGSGNVSGGLATYATSALLGGAHTITATYNGDGNYNASTSSGFGQTVNPASTSTALQSSQNPSNPGQAVTFTATVTPSTAIGSVAFKDGPTILGSGNLSSGVATFQTSALTAGSHSMTAVYNGSVNHAASTSNTVTQNVTSAAILQVAPANNFTPTGQVGGPFTPSDIFYVLAASTGSLNYTITGVPSWLTASATSGTVTNPNGTVLTLTVNATANSMAVGTYPATLTFTNTSNGQGNTTRTVTLTVTNEGTISIFSAVLPASRSVQVNTPASAFATVINTSATSKGVNCALTLGTSIAGVFNYQTTDPATNGVTGFANTPAQVDPSKAQSFVFSITPSAAFAATDVTIGAKCDNSAAAPVVVGLNTLLLSASATPVPDIVALAATASNDGIVNIPGATGTGAFSVASVNVGATASITVSADTGSASLPVSFTLCQTNPSTAACLAPPAATVTTSIAANATPTFSIFVTGSGNVPFDPAGNRAFVRFKDSGGATRGSTSVAIRTQ